MMKELPLRPIAMIAALLLAACGDKPGSVEDWRKANAKAKKNELLTSQKKPPISQTPDDSILSAVQSESTAQLRTVLKPGVLFQQRKYLRLAMELAIDNSDSELFSRLLDDPRVLRLRYRGGQRIIGLYLQRSLPIHPWAMLIENKIRAEPLKYMDYLGYLSIVKIWQNTLRVEMLDEFLRAGMNPSLYDSKNESLLIAAVRQKRFDLVQRLINAGANKNHIGPENKTALMVAAQLGDYPSFEYLVARGVNPYSYHYCTFANSAGNDKSTETCRTPVAFYAVQGGNAKILNKYYADSGRFRDEARSGLRFAIHHCDLQMLENLKKQAVPIDATHFADMLANSEWFARSCRQPIKLFRYLQAQSAENKKIVYSSEVLKAAINGGGEYSTIQHLVSMPEIRFSLHGKLLRLADLSVTLSAKIVQVLLEEKLINVNEKDNNGVPFLFYWLEADDKYDLLNEAFRLKKTILDLYVQQGYQLYLRDNRGNNAIHHILKHQINNRQMLHLLLSYYKNLQQTGEGGFTALHWLAHHGIADIDYYRLLISKGAYVNARDAYGLTPLMRYVISVSNNDEKAASLVTELAKLGANPRLQDRYGINALWLYLAYGKKNNLNLVKAMLDAGVSLDNKNKHRVCTETLAATHSDAMRSLLASKNQGSKSKIQNLATVVAGSRVVTQAPVNGVAQWIDAENYSYSGPWVDSKPHGVGFCTSPIGEGFVCTHYLGFNASWNGPIKAKLFNGQGLLTINSSRPMRLRYEPLTVIADYRGAMVNGVFNGGGSLRNIAHHGDLGGLTSGQKYQGQFKSGVLHGVGTLFYPLSESSNQTASYATAIHGDRIPGKMMQQGLISWRDGSQFSGQILRLLPSGKGQCRRQKSAELATAVLRGSEPAPLYAAHSEDCVYRHSDLEDESRKKQHEDIEEQLHKVPILDHGP